LALERAQKLAEERKNRLEAEIEAERLANEEAVRRAEYATELAIKRAEE
jgi:hypothetical protein